MQTFLPYADFKESAKHLDNKRLGKQRVENLTIMSIILGVSKSKAWHNHPAVKMWNGYAWSLWEYHSAICSEWKRRGFKDTCFDKMFNMIKNSDRSNIKVNKDKHPDWIGSEEFHMSHRQALKYKKPEFYSKFWPNIESKLDYVWPV